MMIKGDTSMWDLIALINIFYLLFFSKAKLTLVHQVMCNLMYFEDGGHTDHDCCHDIEDGFGEMFQNDSEETDGRERKGNRPGVLRCGYCVKQGNVVSPQPLITDNSVFK